MSNNNPPNNPVTISQNGNIPFAGNISINAQGQPVVYVSNASGAVTPKVLSQTPQVGISSISYNGYAGYSGANQANTTRSNMDLVLEELKVLREFARDMRERLHILEANHEKMEMFPALREAYEHYKTIERLCQ